MHENGWRETAGLNMDGLEMDELETIKLSMEDGEEAEFYVLEQTNLMGASYYLVIPVEAEEDACYILKESAGETEEYSELSFVEDETELEALYPIFKELLEDSDMEVEF